MAEVRQLKLVICGDGAVGKTCLLQRFTRNTFPDNYVPTVFENQVVSHVVDGEAVSVECVDTAGQEGYDNLRAISYPGTNVFVVCFAVDNPDSLSNVADKWYLELAREMGKLDEPMPAVVLVGTKSDLIDDCDYDDAKAKSVASNIGAINGEVYLCSALEGIGVQDLFEEAMRNALKGSGGGGGCCLLQ